MANKSIEYAELQLGVHEVYERATAAQTELDSILTRLAEASDKKRDLEAKIQDREMEVASDEWISHPDMAVTRMDKHLKTALNADDKLRVLHADLRMVLGDIEGMQYDKTMEQNNVTIAVARMTQMGGYFNYLAACKTSAKSS